MAGEFDFIDWIRARAASPLNIGIGDDLAAMDWPAGDLLLAGVDQMMDGVHFDLETQSPRAIGQKAMNRNLSDVAAMAGVPVAALVTFALPRGAGIDLPRQLFEGIEEAGRKFSTQIIGGDTGSWPGRLVITVSILARSDGIAPVSRSGAKPGQHIFVSGPLGGSLLGRHLTFEPQVALGRSLGPRVSAMIDLSDGLSRDLQHICRQSGVGAVIDAASIPIHRDAITMSETDSRSPLEHALHDGEDYELLFASDEMIEDCFKIGVFTSEPGVFLQQHGRLTPLTRGGWEHSL